MHGNGCLGVFVQTFKMAKRELSVNIHNRQHTQIKGKRNSERDKVKTDNVGRIHK